MLLAHKIELRPTPSQSEYLDKAMGCRRHCYNQLLDRFKDGNLKWSKKTGQQEYRKIREEHPWYAEVSQRATRNAVDDLDNAFKHFFRRVKSGQKPGFPVFKRKDCGDSFALRETSKFGVEGRTLRIERLKTRVKMRQNLRFRGQPRQVTISKHAGKYYASILVETQDYEVPQGASGIVGVDLGIKDLAILSDGTVIKNRKSLRKSIKRIRRRNRQLSRSKKGSNRRARVKASVARLHKRVADQRKAVCHELSDMLTRRFEVIVLEDLNVAGMVRNRRLALSIADAGFGMLRQFTEYKARLRGRTVILADRFFPSSKTCHSCGTTHDMPLSRREMRCSCGWTCGRDLNAALNLQQYGRDTLERDLKRTPESCVRPSARKAGTLEGVNKYRCA